MYTPTFRNGDDKEIKYIQWLKAELTVHKSRLRAGVRSITGQREDGQREDGRRMNNMWEEIGTRSILMGRMVRNQPISGDT